MTSTKGAWATSAMGVKSLSMSKGSLLRSAGTTVRQMLDLCRSLQGLHYQVAYTGNYPTLLALAARGEVLTLSALVSAAHAVRAGELVAVPVSEPQWRQRSLQVLTLQGQTPSTPVIGFRDYLIEMALKRGQARDGTARKQNEQV